MLLGFVGSSSYSEAVAAVNSASLSASCCSVCSAVFSSLVFCLVFISCYPFLLLLLLIFGALVIELISRFGFR